MRRFYDKDVVVPRAELAGQLQILQPLPGAQQALCIRLFFLKQFSVPCTQLVMIQNPFLLVLQFLQQFLFFGLNPAVLGDFYGNLWEWCGNDFKRNDGISFDASGRYLPSPEGFSAAEKAVRGGSWASIAELVSISSRGSQPPEWCTPFLGFRVILEEAE